MRGLGVAAREVQQPLLDQRNDLDRHLDAEVSACDHHAAGAFLDDRLGVLRRLPLLDLGDHGRVGAAFCEAPEHRLEVRRVTNEAHGDQVDVLLDGEVDPGQVLLADARRGGVDAGEVDSLVGGDGAARLHAGEDVAVAGFPHAQPDRAVREVDRVPARHRCGQPRPSDAERVLRAALGIDSECEVLPVAQLTQAAVDVPEPQLRTREIGQQADLALGALARPAHHRHELLVLASSAVREVEAKDVHAHGDQPRDDLGIAGGGPERGDDLRASHQAEESQVIRLSRDRAR